MSYLYNANLDPRDRSEQLELQMDDGDTSLLIRGKSYDLTPGEIARARHFIDLQFIPEPASADPLGIVRLPVKGNPVDGQAPIWNTDEDAFVPQTVGGVGINLGLGGGNLLPNPTFADGVTGYTAGSSNTLLVNTLAGTFGTDAGQVTRNTSTGAVILTSPVATISPQTDYSASVSLRRASGSDPAARVVTLSVKWYDRLDALISTTSLDSLDSPQHEWLRPMLVGARSPDSADHARVEVQIAGVPATEVYYFDGFQLAYGLSATGYNADFGTASLEASMLAPGSVTTREMSTALIDQLVASVLAAMPPQVVSGRFDFPMTVDPRVCDNTRTLTSTNLYFYRVEGAGTISSLQFNLGTSDAAGTAWGGVYTNVGTGRSARPVAHRASGSVSTATPTGIKTISLGTTLAVAHGDWFAFGTNSATATFLSSAPNATTVLTNGLAHFQTGILPTIPDPVGTLSNYLTTVAIVGL
jgi:hypothetical protein